MVAFSARITPGASLYRSLTLKYQVYLSMCKLFVTKLKGLKDFVIIPGIKGLKGKYCCSYYSRQGDR